MQPIQRQAVTVRSRLCHRQPARHVRLSAAVTAVPPVTAVVAVPSVPPVVAMVAVVAVVAVTVGGLAVRDLPVGGLTSVAVLCLRVLACIVRGVLAVGPTVGVTRPAGLPLPATVTVMAGSLVITLVPLLCAVFSLTVPDRFARGRGRLALDGR
ncbi:hypothetical protein GCM10010287_50330 [Streptomyces variabilis]|uniref:Integral membrane protein n=1 Tax=Streptomyces variabilis TaxID=67372 RepID=A0ABQ2U423_9ACTN|nr:hypothetical protein GCM10010287_50330 [Streptomyces variabilis]